MSARSQLAAAITAGLPATAKVIDDLRAIPTLDPQTTVVVQLFRTKTTPASTRGRYVLEFELWVMSPKTAPEVVEDDLDASLDDVLTVLESDELELLLWTDATRAVHEAGYHGHKITLTITGLSKE